MKKRIAISFLTSLVLLGTMTNLNAADIQSKNSAATPSNAALHVGIVNFKTCVEQSKLGKAEQASFESLKEQMSAILEKTEKELEEIAGKLNDTEHLDSLSPEAEADLKTRFQGLSQELGRYQNQYYQILNQANFKLITELGVRVGEVAASVAKEKNIDIVLNEDACFYYAPALDITKEVITELDKRFDAEEKETPATPAAPASTAPARTAQSK